jgi:hypothetical protein
MDYSSLSNKYVENSKSPAKAEVGCDMPFAEGHDFALMIPQTAIFR